jgi:hypothetical protein
MAAFFLFGLGIGREERKDSALAMAYILRLTSVLVKK